MGKKRKIKADNFAVFYPQSRSLTINVGGLENTAEINNLGKELSGYEHKIVSRNNSLHIFKFPVDKTPTPVQIKNAVAIIDMARKK